MQTESQHNKSKTVARPADGNKILRILHLVRVDDIEFIFYDIERALEKLASEPEATIEPITVH